VLQGREPARSRCGTAAVCLHIEQSNGRPRMVLKKDEWDVLVDAIKSGRLSKV